MADAVLNVPAFAGSLFVVSSGASAGAVAGLGAATVASLTSIGLLWVAIASNNRANRRRRDDEVAAVRRVERRRVFLELRARGVHVPAEVVRELDDDE